MQKYYLIFNEGSKINQIICAILVNFPVFAYGAAIGWMSPMTLLLQSENTPRTGEPFTDTEISWIASAAYLTCIPSNFAMAYIGDRFGRKAALLFISLATLVAWVIKLSSLNTWALVIARCLIGIPMAGCFVTCPAYNKEIAEDSIRGVVGTMVILFQTVGNLFLYVIGDYLSYYTILWICFALPAVHIVLFLFMPESPSFLIKTGKNQEAAKALGWLWCLSEDDHKVQQELNLIKKEQETDDESSGFVLKAVLTDKILFRAFRICMVTSLAREICGAIPVLNFAGDIFSMASKGSGLVLSANQQAMMLGAMQVAGSLLASSIVEKTGRKPLLFWTSLLSGISMCTLASWFLARAFDLYAPDWIPITTLCLCIACDSSGLQPASIVLMAEMFSFKYRGTVMAATMASASLSDFIQMLFFKPLATSVGPHLAFYFFGICCLLASLYVLLCVPETKMRSLEEIHLNLRTKKEKRELGVVENKAEA